ncbi:MAG: TIR domain-containing protein [Bifidobacteriaceae bacterium]|nr:TIR domain-containing protein [Bifidobacteriaceae bacterium]
MDTPLPPFPAYTGAESYACVSYARATSDAAQVYRLLERLSRDGYRIWYDARGDGMAAAGPWLDYEAGRVEDCALFMVFVSPVSMSRNDVRKEVTHAHNCSKPILAVELEPTVVPSGIRLATGDLQGLALHTHGEDQLLARVREAFDRHGVARDAGAEDPDTGAGRQPAQPRGQEEEENEPKRTASAAGMPRRARAQRRLTVGETFADRVPESAALAASAARQEARLRGAEPLTEGVFPNVLVFHGGGGVGKTGLSCQLQRWLTGDAHPKGWGTWTRPGTIAIRWDFHDSKGNLDVAGLLGGLRAALAPLRPRWLAFDLALAAYLEAARPDRSGEVGLTHRTADSILGSLQQVAAFVGIAIPSALTPRAIRLLSDAVLDLSASGLLARPGGLADAQLPALRQVLKACEQMSEESQAPEVAADVAYILTQEIYFTPVAERPALVFFLDAFERLQRRGAASPEPVIVEFVANLPYCLFVVTGRDKLDWARAERTDLGWAGPNAWPGLAAGATEDPRQHLLQRLSDQDTERIYRDACMAAGWDMSDAVIAGLVRRSQGLPLHIEAVLGLTRNLEQAAPGRAFELTDLDGELPAVVGRILDLLRPDEADAFRAACVLPFFDEGLAQAVAGVHNGAVERAIRFALVEHNPSSLYPWRVHDEIRRLVRLDRASTGFWGEADWRAAAQRGLEEAIRRVDEAHEGDSDAAEIEAIVLAIRIGHEWGIYYSGLVQRVQEGPTIRGLVSSMPHDAEGRPWCATDELVALVHAHALYGAERLEALDGLRRRSSEIAPYAGRWQVYHLRTLGRYDEAAEIVTELIASFPAMADFHHHQYAITLRLWRHFQDAIAYEAEHRPDNLPQFTQMIDRYHGVMFGDPAVALAYRMKARSKRFRFELEAGDQVARARAAGIDRAEALRSFERAVALDNHAREQDYLMILGYLDLVREDKFATVLAALRRTVRAGHGPPHEISHLLALRALMTGDRAHARAAFESVDPGKKWFATSWIPTEVWLEELGYPLPRVETQWIISYEQVRENWLRIAQGIIDRAKARSV